MSLYRVGWWLCRGLFRLYFRWRVEGLESFPPHGPVIVACNHSSYLDIPVLGAAVPRTVHFMAKEELFHQPVLRWLVPALHGFPVRRGTPDRRALRHALELLARGEVVGMFPEGTRSRTGQLLPAQGGVALLALHSGAPVVPATILGMDRVFPGGRERQLPRPAPLRVVLGPPLRFPPCARPRQQERDAVAGAIMEAIAVLRANRPAGRVDSVTPVGRISAGQPE